LCITWNHYISYHIGPDVEYNIRYLNQLTQSHQ
jgi:hypothetical protein